MNFEPLLEKAKVDKKLLQQLKHAAVRGQDFELAVKFRELEREYFPDSEEDKKAKEFAKSMELLFRMVGLNVKEDIAFLLGNAVLVQNVKGEDFSISDASKIMENHKRIFDCESE